MILMLIYLALWFVPSSAFIPRCSIVIRRMSKMSMSFPIVDISPQKDGSIMKQILRRGDGMIGRPYVGDKVKIAYKISRLDDTLLDEVRLDAKVLFDFQVGSNSSKVSTGWDLAIQSMMESEIARFTITPNHLQGIDNLCPSAPNYESVVFEFNLVAIVPSLRRSLPSVGQDEDISAEIVQNLMNKRHHKFDKTVNRTTYPIPQPREDLIGTYIAPSNGSNPSPFDSNIKPDPSIRFFDESKNQQDPNRRILGQGQNHTWEENPTQIDISVDIGPVPVLKEQMEIVIEPKHVLVKKDGVLLFSGPLHGKVLPSQSGWAFADPDPTQKYKGYRVVLSLEKSHLSADLWATVLDREYMKRQSEAAIAQSQG